MIKYRVEYNYVKSLYFSGESMVTKATIVG